MNHRGILFLFLAAAVTFSASGPLLAQEGNVPVETRVYDVGSILAPFLDCPLPQWKLPLRQLLSQESAPIKSGSPRRLLTADSLITLIRRVVDQEYWDSAPEAAIEDFGGADCLLVRATSQHHRQIARLLEQLNHFAQAQIRLDVFIVRSELGVMEGLQSADGSLPAPVINELRRKKLGGITTDAAYWIQGRVGQRVHLKSGQVRDVVLDFDAEVAQEAKRLDPFVGSVFSGMSLIMRPNLLMDGRIGIRLVGSMTAPPNVRTRELMTGNSAVVQLLSLPSVHMAQSLAAGSGCGAILALGSEGSADNQSARNRYMVVVPSCETSWKESVAVGTGVELAIMRLGAFVQPALHAASLTRNTDSDERAESLPSRWVGPRIESDAIEFLLRVGEDPVDIVNAPQESLMFVAAAEVHAAILSRVETISSILQPRQVEVRLLETTPAVFRAAADKGDGTWMGQLLQSQSTKEHVLLSGGVSLNGMAQWTVGSEFTYIADRELDVAQKATILSPVVRSGFTGLEVRLRLRNEGQGRHGVDFDATLSGAVVGEDIFNGTADLGIEQVSGALNHMAGKVTAHGSSPCILQSWRVGSRLHLLVLEVK